MATEAGTSYHRESPLTYATEVVGRALDLAGSLARMLRMRRIPITLLAIPGLLVGCGGGQDGSQDAGSGGDSESSAQATDRGNGQCETEVEITGATPAAWTGEGFVTTGGDPAAIYHSERDRFRVTVHSAGEDYPASARLQAGEQTYSSTDGEGVDVAADGSGGEIDADLEGSNGRGVHMVASFDC